MKCNICNGNIENSGKKDELRKTIWKHKNKNDEKKCIMHMRSSIPTLNRPTWYGDV